MKKKKKHGHYCCICGEYKANEKFSGRGHASHICKACHSLPTTQRNERERINKIDRIQENFFLSKENRKRLKGYAGDKRYPEASKYAQDALDDFYGRMDEYHGNIPKEPTVPVVFSELDDKLKKEVYEHFDEWIGEFLSYSDFLPDKEEVNEILAAICEEISETLNSYEPEPYDPAKLYEKGFQFDHGKSNDENIQELYAHMQELEECFDEYAEPEAEQEEPKKELVINNDLRKVWDEVLRKVLAEFQADGVEFISFLDSLNVAVTERLKIKRFMKNDMTNLHRIMKKPEVMYAWEHGFHKREVKTWINRQIERYEKDGYGYFAVTLKDTDKLIGQVGLIKTVINSQSVVELGYLFDNTVWGQGYCTEAAKACIKMAFGELGMDKLYCTVRPENEPSIRVAERLGMVRSGEFVKVYGEKEMPHLIYVLYKE